MTEPLNIPSAHGVRRDASLSPDGVYRYALTRDWFPRSGRGNALFIMLNPSTADASVDDPTIRRCMGFARSWGYDGLTVGNLFGLRATNPAGLLRHPEPVGDANDDVLGALIGAAGTGIVVAAWGARGFYGGRDRLVRHLARAEGRALHVLGLTKAGHPKHPLYVKGDTQPQLWQEVPLREVPA